MPSISPPQVALDATGNGLAFWYQGDAVYHAMDFNRSGQGLAVWVQDDSATTEVRNSRWGALLR